MAKSRGFVLVATSLILGGLWGCAKDITGPAPELAAGGVTRVNPEVVRGEVDVIGLCRDNVVRFVGQGFSPLVLGAATENPTVQMPTVVLEHSDGDPAHVLEIRPGDTAWLDPQTMEIRIPHCAAGDGQACDSLTLPWNETGPGEEGETGDEAWPFGRWNLRVINPNGADALLEQALLMVKPPRLEGIDTGEDPANAIACSNPDMTVGLLGRSFRSEILAIVTDTAAKEWYRGVDGEQNSGAVLASQNRLDITIPQETQMVEGAYTVEVINPEECNSVKEDLLTVIAPPLEAIEPNSQACSAQQMVLEIQGDQWRDGAEVSLINDATSVVCGPVACDADSYTVAYKDDTAYTATLERPRLPAGEYSGRVFFWEGCNSQKAGMLKITQPPFEEVVPASQSCSLQQVQFDLKGQSLRSGATVRLLDAEGDVVLELVDGVATDAGHVLSFVDAGLYTLTLQRGAVPAGKYDVEMWFFEGCVTRLTQVLEITPPPFQDVAPDQQSCSIGDLEYDLTGLDLDPGATLRIVDSATQALVLEITDAELSAEGHTFDQVDATTYHLMVAYATLPAGSYDVELFYYDGCSAVLPQALVVVPPPFTALDPTQICVDVDSLLTLTGSDLGTGALVELNQAALPAAQVTPVDLQTYTALVLAQSILPEVYDVALNYYPGCRTELADVLTAVAAPKVTSVVPPEVCAGSNTHLTIVGEGFGSQAVVNVGPVVGLVPDSVSEDGTTITVTVPGSGLELAAKLDVTVTNVAGCDGTLVGAVTVVTGPTVVAVDPATIYSGVNFPVSLYGSGFGTAATVTLVSADGLTMQPATVQGIVDGNRIDAVVPAGLPAGIYDVVVTDEKGCDFNFAGSLEVTDQLTVRLCSVVPPFGWTGDKSAVSILSGDDPECSVGDQPFQATPRAWLNVNGNLRPIRNVGFVTQETLTGSVPAGYEVGGPYDVLVLNPDGGIGLLPEAFTVTSLPVPATDAINPASVDTSYVGTLTLYGADFRDPVAVSLLTAAGAEIDLSGPTVLDANTITVPLDAGGLLVGVYVVRVTNLDEGTYSDFSALAVTNPSSNLLGFNEAETLPALNIPRRMLGTVSGQTSSAARYLYAVAGEDADGMPLSSIEYSPLDLFGGLGQWRLQRYELGTARAGAGVVRQGRFIWVVGGFDSSGTPLNTVERAAILDPDDAPEFTQFTFTLTGSLPGGAWNYRVSATLPGDHPTNPGGETLPGEMVVVNALEGAAISLQWKPSADPFAANATYNIYRSPAPDSVAGEEVLLASGIPASQNWFVDDGTLTTQTQRPLTPGSTGRFVLMPGTLGAPRAGFGAVVAPDPTGALHLYAAGGQTTGFTFLSTYEFAPLSADGATLGAFVAGAQPLDTARAWPALVQADPSTSDMLAANQSFLFIVGGLNLGGAVKTIYQATIQAGGDAGTWVSSDPSTNKGLPGSMAYCRHNALFFFGGESVNTPVTSSYSGNFETPPVFVNMNSLGGGGLLSPLAYAGLAIETAYLYLVGGTSDGIGVTGSVIRQVY